MSEGAEKELLERINQVLPLADAEHPFQRTLGFIYEPLTRIGRVQLRLKVDEKHLSPTFAINGGMISTLVDNCMGTAAWSLVCHEGKQVSTIEFKLNYLAPSWKDDDLVCDSKVIHKGKSHIVVEAVVRCGEKIIAKSLGTFNVYTSKTTKTTKIIPKSAL